MSCEYPKNWLFGTNDNKLPYEKDKIILSEHPLKYKYSDQIDNAR